MALSPGHRLRGRGTHPPGCRVPGPCLPGGREGSGPGELSAKCSLKPRGLFAAWQDPEFMRDVEAATGVDLGSSRCGGRGKGGRRKHSGLTDLKRQADTARARIAKKVFAK